MLMLTACRGPYYRALATTRNSVCASIHVSREIHTQHRLISITGINISHGSGLHGAFATSSHRRNLSFDSRLQAAFKAPRQVTREPLEPKTQAWYSYYLSWHFGLSSKPRSRYNALQVGVLESKLRPGLREYPLELFNSKPLNPADLHVAGQCLDLCISRHSLMLGKTLAQTREDYVRDRPGSRGLAWSCSLSDAEKKALWSDVSFAGPVTHCLIAEGGIKSVWDWLKLDRSLGPKDPFGDGVLRWKQHVLRAMVEAQVFWSEKTDCWADAIESLVESQTMRFGIGRPSALFLQ
jgi:hypothetical protein